MIYHQLGLAFKLTVSLFILLLVGMVVQIQLLINLISCLD